jgi:hypothetical protein
MCHPFRVSDTGRTAALAAKRMMITAENAENARTRIDRRVRFRRRSQSRGAGVLVDVALVREN